MVMPADQKADARGHFVLNSLDVRRGELEDLAAGLANEVVVVLPLVLALETALSLEGELLGETSRLKELEGTVDRGPSNVRPAFLNELEQIVD